MKIKWVKNLWKKGKHNAFTDLCCYRDAIFCCFREADTHISPDGRIRILRLSPAAEITQSVQLSVPDADLRDPKLSVTPEGKLLLIAYARLFTPQGVHRYSKPICWFSSDGCSWSSPRYFGHKNWWVWRVTWHQSEAYGLAYNRLSQSINLYQGNPRRSFHIHRAGILSLARQGLGYPNESDMLFTEEGTAYALVRRDSDSCTAQLGKATAPYTQWQWYDLGEYIGGPAMLSKDANTALVAGRLWRTAEPKTAVWELNLDDASLTLLATLPSAGDNSYPGMVWSQNCLLLSYYSSHIDNQSAIYLAMLDCR